MYVQRYLDDKWRKISKMTNYSADFKIRKDGSFSVEGEKDPITKLSEWDLLCELAKGSTKAKVVREALLEYFVKRNYLLARHPTMDKYVENENYIPGEPGLTDPIQVHEKYIKSSSFTADELKRRASISLAVSKLYDNYYFQTRDQEWIKSRQVK